MTKPLLPLFPLALALAVSACKPDQPEQAVTPAAEVTIARPVLREIIEWDEYTGRLQAPESVEIRARVSGYLQSINFTDGEMVERGQLLFVIDPRPYEAEVERAKAAVVQAEAQKALAQTNFERAKELQKKNVISQQEFDSRVNDTRAADAALEQANALQTAAQLDLAFTRITAPVSGRVGRYLVSAGNLVAGGSGATLLTTIVSLDPLHAYFEVDEQSFLKYSDLEARTTSSAKGGEADGLAVEMKVGVEDGFPHKGGLSFVDNQVDTETSTIEMRATFSNANLQLTPGLFARIRIPAREQYEAILIPDAAVGSDQSVQYVYVVGEGDVVERRSVTLGPIIDGLRVAREGLQADDRIIVEGLMRVRPGAVVKPTEQEASTGATQEDS